MPVWHDEGMPDSAMGGEAGIVIRDYRTADLEAIFRLDQICFAAEFRFDRESMKYFAEARQAIALVAETDGGRIVGFLIVHVEPVSALRVGYVVTLDVAPQFRRMGLAGALMDEASRRVAAAGVHRMELHVYAGNAEAIRFYESRGYVRVGLQRGFYGGQARCVCLSHGAAFFVTVEVTFCRRRHPCGGSGRLRHVAFLRSARSRGRGGRRGRGWSRRRLPGRPGLGTRRREGPST